MTTPSPAGPEPLPAIQLRELSKLYGRAQALRGVTLTVGAGEVFGLLGPNGAGKTTTVKILTGLVRASGGEARIFGRPAGDPAARRRLGYLPENFRFHDWYTGQELLDLHGRLAGLPSPQRHHRITEVLALVGLSDRRHDRVSSYSKGMTQRIGIGIALLHRPDLVLLDEPTSALDPIGRRDVRALILRLKEQGVTVVLNSHLLSEVELVCDRVAIIHRGLVVAEGRPEDLIGRATVRAELDRVDATTLALVRELGHVVDADSRSVTLELTTAERSAEVAAVLVGAGYRLYALVPGGGTLEEAFMDHVHPEDQPPLAPA
ncbi:MAG: ABC transporter ATP-binding protein [Chloroflexota bacterium]